jgi:Ca2+ transporting ATPase
MNNGFNIDKSEIDNIFRIYQQRKVNEEIDYINSTHKGLPGLAQKLKTDLTNGISNNTLELRRKAFDNNYRYREPMPSFWYFIKDAFGDEILQILCVCAIIEISIGLSPFTENPGYDAFDGIGIVIAICVIVITTAVTNFNKEKKFKQLSDENFKKFQVVCTREGANINLSDEELLVGDRCKVDMGMIIPADGIVISSTNLKLDEASLTGESNLMRKESIENCLKMKNESGKYPSPMVFSGTTVKEGEGWMLVLATGPNSAAGKIREHVMQNKEDEESNKTPLEIKLEDIAEDIGKFGLWSAIITLVALLVKLFYSKYLQMYHKNELLEQFIEKHFHNGTYDKATSESIKNQTYYLLDNYSIWSGLGKDIFQSLILCITIIVVAIPEGLPLAVTLSLSFSVKKMMDDNNLVRHMPACETMGGANYICTDKTGTLTRNKMHVVSFYNNSNKINVNDIDHEHTQNYTKKFPEKYYKFLRDALINNVDIELDGNGDIIVASSSKTDFAFYDLLRGFNENLSNKYQQLDRLKFHSDRKRMSSIVKRDDGKYFIYMKGAPEVVINSCTSYLKSNGEGIVEMQKDPSHLQRLDDITKEYSNLTLRNLAIAFKEISYEEFNNFMTSKMNTDHLNYEIEKTGFTLIGIAAINDALRPGVPKSVDLCRQACVKVIMITGDDQTIAEAIAKNAGIIKPNEEFLSITGKQFIERIGGIVCKTCTMETEKCSCPKTMGQAKIKYPNLEEEDLATKLKKERVHDMDNFKDVVKNLRVIARARAIDKYALVLGLRELDNVVAVTGDGTNDASALSKADVGFAMGKTGTDVARDAADIIILDDNFNSIVHAIKWGRNIFDNIRKFLQFQLSVNFSAVLLVFVSSCIGSESPITAIQMLWINLIMDSLGSLALSTEDPSDELLYRHPHSKREYIINNTMWKMIIVQSLVQFSLVLYLYLYGNHFIVEDHPERLNMIRQLENCFGDFPAEVSQFKHHKVYYYIMDGKKSSWDPMKHLRRNLDPKVCFFFDRTQFEEDQINNLYEAYKWYTSTYGNTVHMTMIFNTFVFYSLFNQINSRIINNNLNIFHRILDNWMFIAVTGTEMIIQFLLVQYGGLVFKCNKEGLTSSQWLWCIGLAATTFVVNFCLKFIRLEAICEFDWGKVLCCPSRGNEEQLIDEEMEREPQDTQKGKRIELSEY